MGLALVAIVGIRPNAGGITRPFFVVARSYHDPLVATQKYDSSEETEK